MMPETKKVTIEWQDGLKVEISGPDAVALCENACIYHPLPSLIQVNWTLPAHFPLEKSVSKLPTNAYEIKGRVVVLPAEIELE